MFSQFNGAYNRGKDTCKKQSQSQSSGEQQEWLHCNLCNLNFKTKQHYSIHCGGTFHANRISAAVSHTSSQNLTKQNVDDLCDSNPSYWTGMQETFSIEQDSKIVPQYVSYPFGKNAAAFQGKKLLTGDRSTSVGRTSKLEIGKTDYTSKATSFSSEKLELQDWPMKNKEPFQSDQWNKRPSVSITSSNKMKGSHKKGLWKTDEYDQSADDNVGRMSSRSDCSGGIMQWDISEHYDHTMTPQNNNFYLREDLPSNSKGDDCNSQRRDILNQIGDKSITNDSNRRENSNPKDISNRRDNLNLSDYMHKEMSFYDDHDKYKDKKRSEVSETGGIRKEYRGMIDKDHSEHWQQLKQAQRDLDRFCLKDGLKNVSESWDLVDSDKQKSSSNNGRMTDRYRNERLDRLDDSEIVKGNGNGGKGKSVLPMASYCMKKEAISSKPIVNAAVAADNIRYWSTLLDKNEKSCHTNVVEKVKSVGSLVKSSIQMYDDLQSRVGNYLLKQPEDGKSERDKGMMEAKMETENRYSKYPDIKVWSGYDGDVAMDSMKGGVQSLESRNLIKQTESENFWGSRLNMSYVKEIEYANVSKQPQKQANVLSHGSSGHLQREPLYSDHTDITSAKSSSQTAMKSSRTQLVLWNEKWTDQEQLEDRGTVAMMFKKNQTKDPQWYKNQEIETEDKSLSALQCERFPTIQARKLDNEYDCYSAQDSFDPAICKMKVDNDKAQSASLEFLFMHRKGQSLLGTPPKLTTSISQEPIHQYQYHQKEMFEKVRESRIQMKEQSNVEDLGRSSCFFSTDGYSHQTTSADQKRSAHGAISHNQSFDEKLTSKSVAKKEEESSGKWTKNTLGHTTSDDWNHHFSIADYDRYKDKFNKSSTDRKDEEKAIWMNLNAARQRNVSLVAQAEFEEPSLNEQPLYHSMIIQPPVSSSRKTLLPHPVLSPGIRVKKTLLPLPPNFEAILSDSGGKRMLSGGGEREKGSEVQSATHVVPSSNALFSSNKNNSMNNIWTQGSVLQITSKPERTCFAPTLDSKANPSSTAAGIKRSERQNDLQSFKSQGSSIRDSFAGSDSSFAEQGSGNQYFRGTMENKKTKEIDESDTTLSQAVEQFFSDRANEPEDKVKSGIPKKLSLKSSKSASNLETSTRSLIRTSESVTNKSISSKCEIDYEIFKSGRNLKGEENIFKEDIIRKVDFAESAVTSDGKMTKDSDPLVELEKRLPPDIMKQITSKQPPAELLEKIADLLPDDLLEDAVEYLKNSATVKQAAEPLEQEVKSDAIVTNPMEEKKKSNTESKDVGRGNEDSKKPILLKESFTSASRSTDVKETKQDFLVAPLEKVTVTKRKYDDIDPSTLQDMSFDAMLLLFQELLQDVLGGLFKDDQVKPVENDNAILGLLSPDDRDIALKMRKTTGIWDLSKIIHTVKILKSLKPEMIEALSQLDKSVIDSSLTGNEKAQKLGVTVLRQFTNVMTCSHSDKKQKTSSDEISSRSGSSKRSVDQQDTFISRIPVQSLLTMDLSSDVKHSHLSGQSKTTKVLLPTPTFSRQSNHLPLSIPQPLLPNLELYHGGIGFHPRNIQVGIQDRGPGAVPRGLLPTPVRHRLPGLYTYDKRNPF